LLRAETREEHPSGDEAAGHLDGQEFSLEEQSLQTTEAADEDEADQSLPCIRSQGRDHRRRNHGRIPGVLGALLLRQHCCSLLQDLHTSPSVSGDDPTSIFLENIRISILSRLQLFQFETELFPPLKKSIKRDIFIFDAMTIILLDHLIEEISEDFPVAHVKLVSSSRFSRGSATVTRPSTR